MGVDTLFFARIGRIIKKLELVSAQAGRWGCTLTGNKRADRGPRVWVG
jgi:hypothetical protein